MGELVEEICAILNEEICSGADRAYGLDRKAAQDIIPIITAACAEKLRAQIARGYEVLIGTNQCEHGKFGWDDCIACYDEALEQCASDFQRLGER